MNTQIKLFKMLIKALTTILYNYYKLTNFYKHITFFKKHINTEKTNTNILYNWRTQSLFFKKKLIDLIEYDTGLTKIFFLLRI